ncbi:MAG: hypothetical protein JSW46_10700 [Gemmatimonadota bacterium]|nr:MAG: hypothetical protein JSW46_10700 [Gemmatimonadota bacterium]
MSDRRAAGWAIGLAAILFLAGAATAQDVRTIAPGMTADEVKVEFGQPDGVSTRGPFIYYFYNNGCEYECGFPDFVIFENGQVVDAVLRAPWNEYAGESSSPKGTIARPTPGGMRLDIPTTTIEAVEVRQAETPPAEMPPAETPPAETPPAETPPPPPPVAPADEVVAEISPEFFAFVPVCAEAMIASGVTEGDAQTLCQCTAMEASSLGVEPSTIAEFTEMVRQDPTYQTEDERIRQASSVCFERLTGGGGP